jgi:hypothetical protein
MSQNMRENAARETTKQEVVLTQLHDDRVCDRVIRDCLMTLC